MKFTGFLPGLLLSFSGVYANDNMEKPGKPGEKVISITNFCPFMCTEREQDRGFTVEITQKIFSDENVSFRTFPWARGVAKATSGKITGILAPGKDEAPKLVYPKQSIGIQKNCFYSKKKEPWRYTSKDSLKGVKLVAFIGWAHKADLEKSLGSEGYKKVFNELAYDSKYYYRAVTLVEKDRAKAFWADPNVIRFKQLEKDSVLKDYENKGCISSHYLYIGFSPVSGDAKVTKELIDKFDKGIEKMRSNGELSKILKKYNISDWKDEKEVHFH